MMKNIARTTLKISNFIRFSPIAGLKMRHTIGGMIQFNGVMMNKNYYNFTTVKK